MVRNSSDGSTDDASHNLLTDKPSNRHFGEPRRCPSRFRLDAVLATFLLCVITAQVFGLVTFHMKAPHRVKELSSTKPPLKVASEINGLVPNSELCPEVLNFLERFNQELIVRLSVPLIQVDLWHYSPRWPSNEDWMDDKVSSSGVADILFSWNELFPSMS